uniref:Uncharacterized protein n=1 Tax=Chromera velia CCMP2878 TaxID=1169474 RepID=A0A0G4EYF9_9ALVE|eukprot:Cvel_14183.t1-p1 / transcript=Cvel_14183.t1 / gene=Cvel_14183 / organism=Chromera_velia_CCMP2878 / gene_product=hypothetical protein / transcript_product=hypothetical protein / location=Cvel_scaffold1000:19081-19908(-) / protein_length=276 / sequence_SO=supercontig / SO=protein_coding / is_pseudo=false
MDPSRLAGSEQRPGPSHIPPQAQAQAHAGAGVSGGAGGYGWNPYTEQSAYHPQSSPLPRWAGSNFDIQKLTDLYQQQLAELNAAHSLLLEDQEKLAGLLAPYITPDGRVIAPPDESVLFLKQGLDLRLLEFEEDCRRIQQTERRLQRKIEESTLNYESMVVEAQGFAESKLLQQVKDQQKIIQLQQRELDELRFQRDVYADETKRLRQLCRYGDWVMDGVGAGYRSPKGSPRGPAGGQTLHSMSARVQPKSGWMTNIRFPNRDGGSGGPGQSRGQQ